MCFISISEQMLDHHGFRELETYVFHWFYDYSRAIGRGHREVEANPGVVGNRPWGGVGEGSFPQGLGLMD